MKKCNVYKDIVFIAMGCIAIALIIQAGSFWLRQQKSYDIVIQSQNELTEDVVKEMGKIKGLYRFIPTSSCHVTLRLEEYTQEATLSGIDLDGYPLAWKSAQEEMVLGNTPVLFFGQETFYSFADSNGNAPGKSDVARWIENYQELELTVAEEGGRERSGKIGGIIEEPASGIYMDGDQMQKIYTALAKTTGGCAKIRGYRNVQQAQELLSGAGFQVE